MKKSALLFCLFSAHACVALAHEVRSPGSIEQYPLDRVSERIYVVHGPLTHPNPGNRGFMNNPGAILTKSGVIVVDPGSSTAIGRELVKKIRTISDKPVIAVFNTHVHGDHWLGNHGIREIYPDVPIYAHERMISRVKSGEGSDWIKIFTRMTKGSVGQTKVVGPNIGLKGGETLVIDGVTIRIHHTGRAHTNHDLMIEVVDDSALFLGDIVVATHIPNSDVPQDASFKGTTAAIETILKKPITTFIPGHGRSGGREVPMSTLQFLHKLFGAVTRYYKQGNALGDVINKTVKDLADYRDWHNFSELRRVINYVYLEVERDNF